MHSADVEAAAGLFKVLSNPSRLELLRLLAGGPRSVGELADASGLRQPLVSQHLKNLRDGGLVSAARTGVRVHYGITDEHVLHVVRDALAHVHEEHDDHEGAAP